MFKVCFDHSALNNHSFQLKHDYTMSIHYIRKRCRALYKLFISFMIYFELLIILAEKISCLLLLYHETLSVKTEEPKKDKGKGKLND